MTECCQAQGAIPAPSLNIDDIAMLMSKESATLNSLSAQVEDYSYDSPEGRDNLKYLLVSTVRWNTFYSLYLRLLRE